MSEFVELEIAADSVIGLQVDTAVSTRTAKVEDTVEARVTRDVLVEDQVAVPAGTRMLGSVVLVETGGRLRDAARLGVRFHTLVMDDGLRVPIVTEAIYREGRSRGSDSVAKIGGAAVGGAILGAIFGGARGAAIGGSIGAAGGTAAALNGEAEPAGLPTGHQADRAALTSRGDHRRAIAGLRVRVGTHSNAGLGGMPPAVLTQSGLVRMCNESIRWRGHSAASSPR